MRRIGFWILCLGLVAIGWACSKGPGPVTPPVADPVVVQQPDPSDVGRDYVLLSWSQSQAPDFSCYEVHEVPDSATEPSAATRKAVVGGRGNTSYRVTGLTPEVWHVFKIRTVTRGGGFAASAAVRAFTRATEAAPPQPVTMLAPVDSSSNFAIVQWTPNRERNFDRYVLYVDSVPGFEPSPADSFVAIRNFRDTLAVVRPLEALTRYYFKVVVYNFAGKHAVSNEIACKTLPGGDPIPPPPPVVRLGEVTNTTVALSWSVVPDTVHDWEAYKVMMDTEGRIAPKDDSKAVATIRDPQAVSYTVRNLLPDQKYYFLVLSLDRSGNIGVSLYSSTRTRPPVNPLYKFGGYGTGPGKFLAPSGVVIDSRGRALIANTGNNRVDVFANPVAGDSTRVASWSRIGTSPLLSPQGLAVDASDNVYICDTGRNRLAVLTAQGDSVRTIGHQGSDSTGFSRPTAVALDDSGNIWVCDRENDRVKKLDPSGNVLAILPLTGQGTLTKPTGICFEPTLREIYVTNQGEHRVVRYALDGTILGDFGGGPSNLPGWFNQPGGIAADAQGHIFVADLGNDRFQVYAAGGKTPINLFGITGMTGGDADIKAARLQLLKPAGMAVSGNGAVILDSGNSRAVVASVTLSALGEGVGRRHQAPAAQRVTRRSRR